ncbi:MAG TPA: hypothetical protein PK102_10300 [bacterium]|nr:hypothetical protein [bacterium]
MFKKISSRYPVQFVKPCYANMEIDPFLTDVPDILERAPRDRKCNITQSEDFIFIAGLISGDYGNYIVHFITKDGISLFLREKDGVTYDPLYKNPFTLGEFFKEKSRISLSTLSKAFKDRFFFIRKEIYQLLDGYYDRGIIDDESGSTLKISGNIIRGEGATAENLLKIAKRIKPPVEIDNDPFLHNLKDRETINYISDINCPPGSLVCPYDGIIKPAYASVSDNMKLTGYAICPKCFGALKTKVLVRGFR